MKTETPETDAETMDGAFKEQGCTITLQQWDYYKDTDGEVVMADFARNLERERNEARQAISDLNQRLIERQESFQAQLIRIEDAWREKLSEAREDAKKLRDALDDAISLIDRCSIDETPGDFHDTHKAINDVLNSTAKLLP